MKKIKALTTEHFTISRITDSDFKEPEKPTTFEIELEVMSRCESCGCGVPALRLKWPEFRKFCDDIQETILYIFK